MNCRSHTRLTVSSNTGGIQAQCSCFACACQISFDQRCVFMHDTAYSVVHSCCSFLLTIVCFHADWFLEEMQLDLLVLPSSETYFTVLFIHFILYYTPDDNVRPGSRAPCMGCLLHSGHNVLPQHPPRAEILPVHRPIPSLREHNVSNQVQCHDLWPISAWKCL